MEQNQEMCNDESDYYSTSCYWDIDTFAGKPVGIIDVIQV
jgi:hypothetical protein